jgi:hypothetical protein
MNQPPGQKFNPEFITKQIAGNLNSQIKLIELKFKVPETRMLNISGPKRDSK